MNDLKLNCCNGCKIPYDNLVTDDITLSSEKDMFTCSDVFFIKFQVIQYCSKCGEVRKRYVESQIDDSDKFRIAKMILNDEITKLNTMVKYGVENERN